MSYFIEKGRFGEDTKMHLERVYNHLFPHSSWADNPRFGILGLGMYLPPIMTNSERVGYAYTTWEQRPAKSEPFTFRYELEGKLDRMGLEFVLADILLEMHPPDPRMMSRFEYFMNEGDRFGGVARAAIGVLKLPIWFLPEPPGRSQFRVHMMRVLGVERDHKPAALIYFE